MEPWRWFRVGLTVLLASAIGIACSAEPPSSDHAGSNVESAVMCWKTMGGLSFHYDVKNLRGGDNFVTCTVSNAAAQYQSANFYKPGAAGKASMDCLVRYDVDEPTGGFWSFEMTSSLSVRYSDSGSKSDGYLIGFAGADCIHY